MVAVDGFHVRHGVSLSFSSRTARQGSVDRVDMQFQANVGACGKPVRVDGRLEFGRTARR